MSRARCRLVANDALAIRPRRVGLHLPLLELRLPRAHARRRALDRLGVRRSTPRVSAAALSLQEKTLERRELGGGPAGIAAVAAQAAQRERDALAGDAAGTAQSGDERRRGERVAKARRAGAHRGDDAAVGVPPVPVVAGGGDEREADRAVVTAVRQQKRGRSGGG